MHRGDRSDHGGFNARGATDAQLLGLAKDGNTAAFSLIVDRYRVPLLRYCAGLTRPERADDAVQQAFFNAWLALGRGAPVRELRPWLYSIARNAAIDQLRAHRGELVELSPDLEGGADPAHVAAQRDEIDDVLRAVAELPERQRTALIETAVHGRTTEHVAGEMGMSGGALRQLVHRARTSVRGMVTSVLPTPLASWFAQTGGDEGTRRAAALLGGAGQGATAALAAATATVASVGALGTAGITNLATGSAEPERRAVASSGPGSASGTASAGGEGDASRAIVRLPLTLSETPASDAASTTVPAAAGAGDGRADERQTGRRDDSRDDDGGDGRPSRGGSGYGGSANNGGSSDRRSGSGSGGGEQRRQNGYGHSGDAVDEPTFSGSERPRVSAASNGGHRDDGSRRGSGGGGDRGDRQPDSQRDAGTESPTTAAPAPESAPAPTRTASSSAPTSSTDTSGTSGSSGSGSSGSGTGSSGSGSSGADGESRDGDA